MTGRPDARTRAIERHLPLVRSIARRYAQNGEPVEDLVQVGTIGLIKAVDRFDPARHRDLAALARPAIEGEIRHHLRDRAAGVRVPRPDREVASRLRAAEDELTAAGGRTPAPEEVARAAGVAPERAAAAVAATAAAVTVPLEEMAAGGRTETEAAEARALLEAGWAHLDDRERRMLELRYLDERSQAEIARELGLSQAHVSRLLRAALERLREAVGAPAADDAPAPERPPARSGRLLLRLPQSLHGALAAAAEAEGVPLNTYINGVLAAAVGRPDGAPPPAQAEPEPDGARRRPALLVLNAVVIAVAAVAGLVLLLLGVLT